MIGNIDWFVKMNCNLKVVMVKEIGKYVVVFYDFDFFGFVNVIYVKLNVDYKLVFVRDRVFLGF